MKITFGLLLSLMVCIHIQGQAPNLFNYQSVVRNSMGEPQSNKNVSMRSSILEDSVDGNTIYSETHNLVTSNLGLVTAAIGSGTIESGDFNQIDWAGGARFIKIEFDTEGGTNYSLAGVQQLLSVPYALYAEKSGNAIAYTAGSGIGINGNTITNTGISKWNNGSIPNSIHYNGRVGIGTDAPARIFHLNAGFQSGTFPSSGFAVLGGGDTSTPDGLFTNMIIGRSQHQQGTMWLQSFHSGSAPDPKWYLSLNPHAGNVGVGTYQPRTKLHLSSGDFYVQGSANGIILSSETGTCYKIRVNSSGQLITEPVTCP